MTRIWGIVRGWMTRRWWLGVSVALGMVCTLPSLNVGLVLDDYWHYATFVDVPGLAKSKLIAPKDAFDLFAFCDGDEERMQTLKNEGVLPWWTNVGLKAAFWRPVTSLTHWVDYRHWPEWPVLMHVHSVLWYGAMVFAVGMLYRSVLGMTWVAGLAMLLYAVDDAHGMPVGFLANRNSLLATFFGTMSVVCHIKWRGSGWRIGAILAPVLFGVALLSAEAGVGALAYYIAYALILDGAGWRRGLAKLWPYVVVLVAWRIAWQLLGYGISTGTGFYVDPIREPWGFLEAVLTRGPILLFGHWLGGSDVSIMLDVRGLAIFWGVAVVLSVVIFSVMIGVIRQRATARFWLVGMFMALIPICSAVANDRMLVFVGIGGMGLIAEFAAWAGKHRPYLFGFKRKALVVVCGGLLFVHVALAPAALAWRSANAVGPKAMMAAIQVSIPDESQVDQQELVVVNTPLVLPIGCLSVERALAGKPVPQRVRLLGPSAADLTLTRTNRRTLRVRPKGGYLTAPFDRLFRGTHAPFLLGALVNLDGVEVEISELTEDGRPAVATFRFAEPLDAESYQWVVWRGGMYVPFEVPGVGQTVQVPCALPSF